MFLVGRQATLNALVLDKAHLKEIKGFTCGKWIIGYNFGIDDGTQSKFGTHEELIVLNISKYEYRVDSSRDISRDHFAKNRKLLTNWL